MKVSVVIPSYNRHKLLYRVLWSLWRQQDKNYEVLVMNDDDESEYKKTERVVDAFQKVGMPVRHFYTGQYKRGRGWSVETYPYNVGIRNATGDVIILNSGDVMSVTFTIDQHRQRHLRGNNYVVFSTVHAILAVVQDNIEKYNWKKNPAVLLFKGSCYKMFTGIGRSYTMAYTTEDAGAPYHFQMSIRKHHLWEIRGFDEDYYGAMQCGDDDLADRLRRKCLIFEWLPHILAIHQSHRVGSASGWTVPNTSVESGHTLFQKIRRHQSIVRNVGHEWGQYPRDVSKIPIMSGALKC